MRKLSARPDRRNGAQSNPATPGKIIHFPRPMTRDHDEIARGRFRALEQYQTAATDYERMRALHWCLHWRWLDDLRKGHALINGAQG